ncbi:MAG: glycosyltransferase family 2 protein [Candidatus Shapirobacteria bacterium]
MELSVIVVNWNTRSLLLDCLRSIFDQTKGISYEVWVVDNASTDDSVLEVKRLKQKIKNLFLIENKKNLGFAQANNQAIKQANGDFVLLLNSDTKLIGNALEKMINFARKNSRLGILGPRLLNRDKTFQPSVAPFYFLANTFLSLFGGDRFLRSSPLIAKKVDWVSGSCFLIRKQVIDKTGGLDENFFMYLEEMEFCYRAQKAGFQTWFYPGASVYHLVRGSSPAGRQQVIWWTYKSFIYFYQKHFAPWQLIMLKWLLRLKALAGWFWGAITGNPELKITYEKAFRLVR